MTGLSLAVKVLGSPGAYKKPRVTEPGSFSWFRTRINDPMAASDYTCAVGQPVNVFLGEILKNSEKLGGRTNLEVFAFGIQRETWRCLKLLQCRDNWYKHD